MKPKVLQVRLETQLQLLNRLLQAWVGRTGHGLQPINLVPQLPQLVRQLLQLLLELFLGVPDPWNSVFVDDEELSSYFILQLIYPLFGAFLELTKLPLETAQLLLNLP